MERFGFKEKWIGWIKECVTTTSISVLVNGSLTKDFIPDKELRQGLIKGAEIGNNGMNLTDLQFADDTIIFYQADWGKVVNIKRLLRCFKLISRLKINFHTSIVGGVRVDDSLLDDFSLVSNCKAYKFPVKYRGLPLEANPRLKKTWQPVLQKLKSKLASWKRKFLSFGGRLTFVKSVLSALPIYYFLICRVLVAEIDKIRSGFLWRDNDVEKKLHLVKWEKMTKGKEFGGLGLRNIRVMNDAFI
ncbi:uncharacterized protein LOC114263262 [Camellia sinensis]|uniref:uncharacterized protein LOC114263262 n=1 Tax=Camellia sinensis TaxID=4442 RepID=UPI00103615BA|nr:uncharacterized protein LOC114263262 [Camellia sinensis]